MTPIVSAEEARRAWLKTPRRSPEELKRWQELWVATAGERPEGSVAIQGGA